MRYRKTLFLLPLITLNLFLCLVPQPAGGQASQLDQKSLIGYWSSEAADGATLFIILKSGNQASSFWSDTTDTKVEKGVWTLENNQAVITWESGYRDVLTQATDSALLRRSYSPQSSLSGPPQSESKVNKINRGMVGNLIVEGKNENDAIVQPGSVRSTSAKNKPSNRSEFIGYWEIPTGGNKSFYVQLKRGGQAFSAQRKRSWRKKVESEKGTWTERPGQASIVWDNGYMDTLAKSGNSLTYNAYSKSAAGKPENQYTPKMLTAIEAKGYFEKDASPGVLVESFIGFFAAKDKSGQIFFVENEHFGESKRIEYNPGGPDIKTKGNWKMMRDGMHITWEDGFQDTIRITNGQALTYSRYAPQSKITDLPIFQSPTNITNEQHAKEYFAELEGKRRAAEIAAAKKIEEERKRQMEEEKRIAEEKQAKLLAQAEARRIAEQAAKERALAEAKKIEALRNKQRAEELKRKQEEERKRNEEQQALKIAEAEQKAQEKIRLETQRKALNLAKQKELEKQKVEETARIQAQKQAQELAKKQAIEKQKAEEAARIQTQKQAQELAKKQAIEKQKAEESARIQAQKQVEELAKRQAEKQQKLEELARLQAQKQAEIQAQKQEKEKQKARQQAMLAQQKQTAKERKPAQPPRPISSYSNPPVWATVFQDQFDSANLNGNYWSPFSPTEAIINNELGGYIQHNASTKGGILRLRCYQEDTTYAGTQLPYSAGIISTYNKQDQVYGRYEISFKIPEGQGLRPLVSLVNNSGTRAINIIDIRCHEPDKIYFSTESISGGRSTIEQQQTWKGLDFSRSNCAVVLEWTPHALVFFVNGQERARMASNVPNDSMYLTARIAVGGDLPGRPSGWTSFPSTFAIDHIKVSRLQ